MSRQYLRHRGQRRHKRLKVKKSALKKPAFLREEPIDATLEEFARKMSIHQGIHYENPFDSPYAGLYTWLKFAEGSVEAESDRSRIGGMSPHPWLEFLLRVWMMVSGSLPEFQKRLGFNPRARMPGSFVDFPVEVGEWYFKPNADSDPSFAAGAVPSMTSDEARFVENEAAFSDRINGILHSDARLKQEAFSSKEDSEVIKPKVHAARRPRSGSDYLIAEAVEAGDEKPIVEDDVIEEDLDTAEHENNAETTHDENVQHQEDAVATVDTDLPTEEEDVPISEEEKFARDLDAQNAMAQLVRAGAEEDAVNDISDAAAAEESSAQDLMVQLFRSSNTTGYAQKGWFEKLRDYVDYVFSDPKSDAQSGDARSGVFECDLNDDPGLVPKAEDFRRINKELDDVGENVIRIGRKLNQATRTRTATPSPVVIISPSPTPTASETPSITPTPSASSVPSQTPSTSFIVSVTPSISPSASASDSASLTPTISFSLSLTPTPSITPTPRPSASASDSASPTPSISRSPSGSVTATWTVSPSVTVTATLSLSPSPTLSVSQSESSSVSTSPSTSVTTTRTESASYSLTPSISPSPTSTTSETKTVTQTPSKTTTRTATVTRTPTPSPSATSTSSASATASASVTSTVTKTTKTPTKSKSTSHSVTTSESPSGSSSVTAVSSSSSTTSLTPSGKPSATRSASMSKTATESGTKTASTTATTTYGPSSSVTRSTTVSSTRSPNGTRSPTATVQSTMTVTPTPTVTPTSDPTSSPTASESPAPSVTITVSTTPSVTYTIGPRSITRTVSPSPSASATASDSPSKTPSSSPSSSPSPEVYVPHSGTEIPVWAIVAAIIGGAAVLTVIEEVIRRECKRREEVARKEALQKIPNSDRDIKAGRFEFESPLRKDLTKAQTGGGATASPIPTSAASGSEGDIEMALMGAAGTGLQENSSPQGGQAGNIAVVVEGAQLGHTQPPIPPTVPDESKAPHDSTESDAAGGTSLAAAGGAGQGDANQRKNPPLRRSRATHEMIASALADKERRRLAEMAATARLVEEQINQRREEMQIAEGARTVSKGRAAHEVTTDKRLQLAAQCLCERYRTAKRTTGSRGKYLSDAIDVRMNEQAVNKDFVNYENAVTYVEKYVNSRSWTEEKEKEKMQNALELMILEYDTIPSQATALQKGVIDESINDFVVAKRFASYLAAHDTVKKFLTVKQGEKEAARAAAEEKAKIEELEREAQRLRDQLAAAAEAERQRREDIEARRKPPAIPPPTAPAIPGPPKDDKSASRSSRVAIAASREDGIARALRLGREARAAGGAETSATGSTDAFGGRNNPTNKELAVRAQERKAREAREAEASRVPSIMAAASENSALGAVVRDTWGRVAGLFSSTSSAAVSNKLVVNPLVAAVSNPEAAGESAASVGATIPSDAAVVADPPGDPVSSPKPAEESAMRGNMDATPFIRGDTKPGIWDRLRAAVGLTKPEDSGVVAYTSPVGEGYRDARLNPLVQKPKLGKLGFVDPSVEALQRLKNPSFFTRARRDRRSASANPARSQTAEAAQRPSLRPRGVDNPLLSGSRGTAIGAAVVVAASVPAPAPAPAPLPPGVPSSEVMAVRESSAAQPLQTRQEDPRSDL